MRGLRNGRQIFPNPRPFSINEAKLKLLNLEGKIMKKLIKASLFIGAALLSLGSGSVAYAATTPQTSTSTADLTPGTITLDSVPGGSTSSTDTGGITFGTVASSASDTSYKSTGISSALHVTNPGQATGWAVTVSNSDFTDASGGTLKGAVLSLDSTKTPAISADAADNVSALPTFDASLALSSAPVAIASAPAGAGVGAYTASYNSGDASLSVPAGNVGGSYTSTLTWTLSNAPS